MEFLTALLVWLSLTGWGLYLTRHIANLPLRVGISLWVGWGLFSGVLSVWGVLQISPLYMPTYGVLGLGWLLGARYVTNHWRNGWDARIGLAALCCLPWVWLATQAEVALWDDMAHRLPSIQFLVQHHAFPNPSLPPALTNLPGYPYGHGLIGYAQSLLAVEFLPLGTAHFHSLMLFSSVLILIGLCQATLRQTAGMVLLSSLLFPAFQDEFLFSAYSDIPLGLAVAVSGILLQHLLAALAAQRLLQRTQPQGLMHLLLPLALVLLLVVTLKHVGSILVLCLGVGAGVVALQNGSWRHYRTYLAGGVAALPAVLMVCLWQIYLNTQLSQDLPLPSASAPRWQDALTVLIAMGDHVWEKPGIFIPIVLAMILVVISSIRRHAAQGLAPLVVVLCIGYPLFLYASYLTFFTAYEGNRAASFERYMLHVSYVAWWYTLVQVWPWLLRQTQWPRAWPSLVGPSFSRTPLAGVWAPTSTALAVMLLSIATGLMQAPRLLPEHQSLSAFADRSPAYTGQTYLIYDPQGDGYRGMYLRYLLHIPAKHLVNISRFNAQDAIERSQHVDVVLALAPFPIPHPQIYEK